MNDVAEQPSVSPIVDETEQSGASAGIAHDVVDSEDWFSRMIEPFDPSSEECDEENSDDVIVEAQPA